VKEAAAERVHVGAKIDGVAECLLWRDVEGRSDDASVACDLRRAGVEGLRNAEVRDLQAVFVASGIHEEVGWLDVAMHDARALRVTETARRLDHELARSLRIERFAALEAGIERLAVHELHREVDATRFRHTADGVELYDVRRSKARVRLRFLEEALLEPRIVLLRPNQLEGDRTAQRRIERAMHGPRSALAQQLLHLEVIDSLGLHVPAS
jgi:hypothetical protein